MPTSPPELPTGSSQVPVADLATIAHDGKVVVVGTGFDGVLHYTVRQSGFENTALDANTIPDLPGFENWRVVPLDRAADDPSVRAHEAANLVDGTGEPILRSRYDAAAAKSAVGRVKLISGLGHLYMFRVSTDNRLLMNRFVLDGMTNELIPKLEVRFRRSGQKLAPEGGSSAVGKANLDTLDFRDADRNSFYEPTQELSFLGTFSEGEPWFAVELLPTAEHERHRWNFFVHVDGQLRLVSVAASAEGLVDPKDQIKSQPDPDQIDRKIIRTLPGIVDRRLRLPGRVFGAFDSSLYHNQVERKTKGGPQLLKESTRVMLSVPVEQTGRAEPAIAAVSFAVNSLGELARIDRTANAEEVLVGKTKEVLLPLADLEDIKVIADSTPPPEGAIRKLAQSQNETVAISTDENLTESLREGQEVEITGTRSYDGVYTATSVVDGSFEIAAVFDETEPDQGYWEAIDDGKGLVFENMIASYERTAGGGLKVTCLSHNISEGDEIEISGSQDHDGIYPISDVGDDNSFELDRVWPVGEVVNLSRRPRRGLSFDGKGDYLKVEGVDVPAHFSDARLERTVSAWVYLEEVTGQHQTIFATKSRLFHFYVNRSGKAAFEVTFADGHKATVVDSEELTTGIWTHLTAMFDYQGETTGDTTLVLCRGGRKVAEKVVETRKPLHLPLRNLKITDQALAISSLQHQMATSSAITMEAWVSTRQTGRGVVASWQQNGLFTLAVTGDRQQRFAEWATGADRLLGTIHLPNDDWHHLAATFDPSTGAKAIYVNGEPDSAATVTGAVNNGDRLATKSDLDDAKALKKAVALGYLGAGTAPPTVTAADVTLVAAAGAAYKQTGPERWSEVDTEGKKTGGRYRQAGRTETTVRLQTEGDSSHRLEIDMSAQVVNRIDYNHPIADLTITQVNARNDNRPLTTSAGFSISVPSWVTNPPTQEEILQKAQQTQQTQQAASPGSASSGGFRMPNLYHLTHGAATAAAGAALVNTARRVDHGDGYFVHTAGASFIDPGTWREYDIGGNQVGEPWTEDNRDSTSIHLRRAGADRRQLNVTSNQISGIDTEHTAKLHDITSTNGPFKDPEIGDRYDGFVADVRVWNRARSAAQVAGNRTGRLTGTERNLIAHWPLIETDGAELADLTRSMAHVDLSHPLTKVAWFVEPHRAPGSRQHYDGQPYTDSLTVGSRLDERDRYVLELDGQDARVNVPSITDDLTGGYTVAAWARWDEFRNWGRVIDFGNGQNQQNIILSNQNVGRNDLAFWTPGGWVSAPGVLTLGQWHHVAATVTADGSATLYCDGAPVATGQVAAPDSISRAKNFIGRSNWAGEANFKGAIRDVQLWSRPLEAIDIKYYKNTQAQGTEDGLFHHWPMRTATIKGKKRIVDQGTATARHADLVGGAKVVREARTGPPTPLTELRGKVSDVQLWDVNRRVDAIRQTMHDQLTGNEYGLVGYWRCGGILEDETPGTPRRVTPDFAADGHDAEVVGDTYVSARDLARSSSLGPAVKYANADLVAVTQRARYRETFEFRSVDGDGEFLGLDRLEDADGRGSPIFEFAHWGRKTRTSEDQVDFRADQSFEFVALGDGWFRAQCDVTIPDGVNLIRCFEIDKVSGRWVDEPSPPEGEWMTLNVRKHRLELISDSISRRSFSDDVELPLLLDNAAELELAIRRIPRVERTIGARRTELNEVLESLIVFSQQDRYRDEQAALTASSGQLRSEIGALDGAINALYHSIFSHCLVLWGVGSAKVVDLPSWERPYIFPVHYGANQVWHFERQASGHYKIASRASGEYLTGGAYAEQVLMTTGDNPNQYWTTVHRGHGYYSITNVGNGYALDVFGGLTSTEAPIITFPYHGGHNQLWQVQSWHGERKPTYQAERNQLVRPRDAKAAELGRQTARLQWLNGVLADLSDARKQAFEDRRDAIEAEVRALQDEVNGLNTRYIETAALASEAQTMALVAEDELGLKTYGAVLGFAAPTSGVTSAATAEGNVQLSYFDTQGRMRFTDYDATSDSTNAAYEQWLPSTIAVCPDLSHPEAMVKLDQSSPIELDPLDHTIEAWFYYPLPFHSSGLPYPVSQFTSDSTGQESAVAVADNRRLGTVVDGFFHDAGIDLSVELDRGWHHVAARTEGAVTRFYLDGEPVGHGPAELAAIERYAIDFPGGPVSSATSYLKLPATTDENAFANGFTVQAWVRWNSFGFWCPIVDLGNGSRDNIYLSNHGSGRHLALGLYHGTGWVGNVPSSDEVLQTGVWTNVAATIGNGIAVLYVNGVEVGRGDCANPNAVNRTTNYIGLSNWHAQPGHRPFDGAISDLRLWGRALSAPEIQSYAYTAPPADVSGLVYHLPMKVVEEDGTLKAAESKQAAHADLVGVTSRQLVGRIAKPIVALGNHVSGGAPAGKLAEVRVWDSALPDEEIKVHSLIHLTGNEPELKANYRLDDVLGSEPDARDLTGNHRPATPQRALPVARTAKIGNPGTQVARFDGSTDQTISIDGIDLGGKSFTIEFWVKRQFDDRDEWIVLQGTPGNNANLHLGFRRSKQYALAFYFDDLNHPLPGAKDLAVNDWVHIANTFDVSTKKQTLYFDGKKATERTANGALRSTGPVTIGNTLTGQLAELRIWGHARTADQVAAGWNRRATGTEEGLIARLPLDDTPLADTLPAGVTATATDQGRVRSDDLPIVPGPSLVTAEYSTVGVDPHAPDSKRAVLRRFFGFATDGGGIGLYPEKRIEELVLKWIGNAQFEPTLLGYIEGAPPVPSENLTINYDYDSATSIELIQSDEVAYSWNRNRDIGWGLDINAFLGAAWSVSGGAFIQTKLTEGHAGVRGTVNTQWRDTQSSMIKASSTDSSRDRLDLRGSYELSPRFPNLGNRYVPKNVGYALVVSGLADVFVTQTKRTGRMVAYEVMPMEDMPPDVNTITFLINPAYTLNGSLDGLVGSHAADPRFYRHVPDMRAQYGSRYPASYFNLRQAYDLKAQIERWDKQRESYFVNFDAKETGTSDTLLDQIPASSDRDDYGQVDVDDGSGDESGDGTETDGSAAKDAVVDSYAKKGSGDIKKAGQRKAEIEKRFANADKASEANTAFVAWQRRMEGLQVRAAKRNIFNTYVWDADGGIRFEEQSVANTIEHTIGGSFTLNATLGFDGAINIGGFKGELQAMATHEMSQTMSKTEMSTRSFELSVRLDGVERKGITDADDYPVMPGEKVDRYRFMSFYLEGDTDHFTDFFDQVVDPEWLMSNDEEARALRQVARGRPNKTWRVLHRVTYVERPALMGFGRDLRPTDDLERASQEVFNYFDALEQQSGELRAEINSLGGRLDRIGTDVAEIKRSQQTTSGNGTGAGSPPADGTDGSGRLPTPAAGSSGDGQGASMVEGMANATTDADLPVDINNATAQQFLVLPGIGTALAQAIVDLRTQLGRFATLDQLAQVSGISQSTVDDLRPLLTLGVIDLTDGVTGTGTSNSATSDSLAAEPTQTP